MRHLLCTALSHFGFVKTKTVTDSHMPRRVSCLLCLQPTGGYQPQVTGGMRPMGPYASAPSSTGGYTPQATGYVGAGPTGGLAAAGPTGSVAGGVLPGFPPVTPADIQRYQAAFLATDSDRDGLAKVRMMHCC